MQRFVQSQHVFGTWKPGLWCCLREHARWFAAAAAAAGPPSQKRKLLADGPTLADFLVSTSGDHTGSSVLSKSGTPTRLLERQIDSRRKRPTVGASASVVEALRALDADLAGTPPAPYKVFIETYGCAMNTSDSEIVASILAARPDWFQLLNGPSASPDEADVVLINSCAIRDKPEVRVLQRLSMLRAAERGRGQRAPRRILGLLGCMAERLKTRLLDEMPSKRLVDLVVGPDSYRDLPLLLQGLVRTTDLQRFAYHVQLSLEETYADIAPLRDHGLITAYVSIMRGCNNHCAFCVVPQTRGPERSREPASIWNEIESLGNEGFKEVVLLGQNVNSYCYQSDHPYPKVTKFADLLEGVCEIAERHSMRVRYTSPHPKDFPHEVLRLYTRYAPGTLCRQIHVPMQSGSSEVLRRMRRGYTREEYLALVARIRDTVGADVALSTDIISGFCGETEAEHAETISLMEQVRFDQAFMFAYSERERTIAARLYADDIPKEVKLRRLGEIISTQLKISAERARAMVGTEQRVLVEEVVHANERQRLDSEISGKQATPAWIARTESNRRVWISFSEKHTVEGPGAMHKHRQPCIGDYVEVSITGVSGNRLIGEIVN